MVQREKAKKVASYDIDSLKELKILTSQAAIRAIKKNRNEVNKEASLRVMLQYNRTIERLRLSSRASIDIKEDEKFQIHRVEFQFKAIQIERDEVQSMFESGEISRSSTNHLRQFINYLEAGMFDGD
ncbi:hypothetical protein [Paenibacillus crassostreae]|uniref:Uncharacterized protein n=2 Tax=Paenibacillus crassostreae TaxID=1763538 RepID=A0A167CIZ4_9BACL|nr:hypothetical protein [Paenibacillus crassostreae]AOZ91828.1 hypothetical protein LPB68_06050 [Paenibacillus crassostreae]OAB73249.1 hypothetical protein PNBC_14240 [Paenibacillus crassostreae]